MYRVTIKQENAKYPNLFNECTFSFEDLDNAVSFATEAMEFTDTDTTFIEISMKKVLRTAEGGAQE